MKKTLLPFIIGILATVASAQTFTSAQPQLRQDIASYLKAQGLKPIEQKDGWKFQSEGKIYYVEIDTAATAAPVYVCLCRYVRYTDQLPQEQVVKHLNELNGKYGVKVFCRSRVFVLSTELFLTDAHEFSDIFPTLMNQLKHVHPFIQD